MAWALIQTLSNAERYAEKALTAAYRGCQVYFPKVLVQRSHAGRVDVVERPFIPRYAFVDDSKGYRVIRTTPGVSNVVHYASHAVAKAVDEIKRREGPEGFVELDPALVKDFRRGDKVRVSDGVESPFFGYEGLFREYVGIRRAKILLDMLGYKRPVELEIKRLERV